MGRGVNVRLENRNRKNSSFVKYLERDKKESRKIRCDLIQVEKTGDSFPRKEYPVETAT